MEYSALFFFAEFFPEATREEVHVCGSTDEHGGVTGFFCKNIMELLTVKEAYTYLYNMLNSTRIWLVLSYNRLEDSRIHDVIIGNFFPFIIFNNLSPKAKWILSINPVGDYSTIFT